MKALTFCEAIRLYSDEHSGEAQEGVSNYLFTDGLNTREGRPMGITLGTEKKNTRGPLTEGYCVSCGLNELRIMQRGKGVCCHLTKS